MFVVSLSGSATGWAASLGTNPDGFLTLGATTGRHGEELVVSYGAHTGADERKGTLTLTTTGGTGTGTETVEIRAVKGFGSVFGG